VAKAKAFSSSVKNSLLMNRVSEWNFDETSGNSVLDSWGLNNGTLASAPVRKSGADCVSGGCLEFDGTDDYIDCSNGSSLDITGPLTISAWVFREGSQNYPMMVVKGDSHLGANYQFYLYSPSYKMGFWFGSSSTDWTTITSNSGLEADKWYYVTMVYGANKVLFYLNGSNDGEKTILGTPAVNTNSLFVGTRSGANPFLWKGKIDEVRIYNAVLPSSAIRENYLAGLDKLLASNQITEKDYQQRLADLNSTYATNE
jgi:hypothetical protein